MFRRIVTIDGDRFLMQMMTSTQHTFASRYAHIKVTKHLNFWSHDKAICRLDQTVGLGDMQWILDEDDAVILEFSKREHQYKPKGRLGCSEEYYRRSYCVWVSLMPIDSKGKVYRLDQKDFPDGTLTYGGSLYGQEEKKWTAVYTCGLHQPFPMVGDTDGEGLPWVVYDGILLSRLPLYTCTTEMLIEEFVRAAEWRSLRSLSLEALSYVPENYNN